VVFWGEVVVIIRMSGLSLAKHYQGLGIYHLGRCHQVGRCNYIYKMQLHIQNITLELNRNLLHINPGSPFI
jgi:hypothetical protein